MPFRAPQSFYDLQPPAADVPLAAHKTAPIHMPDVAWHDSDDSPSPWQPLPDDVAHQARRSYRAAISFMDSNVGNVTQYLKDQGLCVASVAGCLEGLSPQRTQVERLHHRLPR